MTQVKMFHVNNLEKEINVWLLNNDKVEVVDIKYDFNNQYKALLIYKC